MENTDARMSHTERLLNILLKEEKEMPIQILTIINKRAETFYYEGLTRDVVNFLNGLDDRKHDSEVEVRKLVQS